MGNIKVYDGFKVPVPADTLQFCDEDIQAMFRGGDEHTTYLTFEPLLAQLIKELKLLNNSLRGEGDG